MFESLCDMFKKFNESCRNLSVSSESRSCLFDFIELINETYRNRFERNVYTILLTVLIRPNFYSFLNITY